MTKEYFYRIAGFKFSVRVRGGWSVDRLLPSFRPFRLREEGHDEILFHFVVTRDSLPVEREFRLLETSAVEFGRMRLLRDIDCYRMEIDTTEGNLHYMHVSPHFSFAIAKIERGDRYVSEVLSSMLRVVFSQSILRRDGFSLHASAVVLDGKAYLFMGRSGTGKSTHASLWMDSFKGCRLLNDDNPVVRVANGQATVYGTAWSGKTRCYKNESYPLGGVVRLAQARQNRFVPQKELDAFVTLLPGCASFPETPELHARLCDMLVELTSRIPVGMLECLPDKEAARICRKALIS